jgi:hypothetical protein
MSTRIDIKTSSTPPVGATLIQTGQTTSYATGDDITRGRATNFTTLASNNPWGNTNRFTDTAGTQTYANGIVVDWSTYDGSTVLCYYIGDSSTFRSFNASIGLHLTSTFGGLTNWKLWNLREVVNVCDISKKPYKMNYPPFNFANAARYFITSSDYDGSAIYGADLGGGILITTTKTNALLQVYVRNCTVTGTTLS